jgi:hypothetical protein
MTMSTTFEAQTYGMITKALTRSLAPHLVMPVTLAQQHGNNVADNRWTPQAITTGLGSDNYTAIEVEYLSRAMPYEKQRRLHRMAGSHDL